MEKELIQRGWRYHEGYGTWYHVSKYKEIFLSLSEVLKLEGINNN